MPVHVKSPGLLSTVQDLGRYHYAHVGISIAGAADRIACRIANLILGNDQNAPVLEMTLTGATLEFDERALIVLTGAACVASIGSTSVISALPMEVAPGDVLSCGRIERGCRTYMAVRGGFAVPNVMGSASTHLAGHIGGILGRSLRTGDILHLGKESNRPIRPVDAAMVDSLYFPAPVRITRGPQHEWFDKQGLATFLTGRYSVSEHSNRAGLRLEGPAVTRERQSQLLTEGTSLGAIQIPEDGRPIILYVDQQTTGGYPKLANVIAADLHRIAQLRPRQEVSFQEVSISEATSCLREQEVYLASIFTD